MNFIVDSTCFEDCHHVGLLLLKRETRTGFKYEYHTGTYLNNEGKMYRIVYDYAWMDFSDQKIVIVRKKD